MPVAKMHADELDIDGPLVRRLLAEQFPEWAELPIEPVLPRGTDNALFRVGEELVARLPRREHNVRTLEKERAWLPRLAPLLPLAVPLPLADGAPGEGYPLPWAVYRWLPGENATVAPAADPLQLVSDLSGFIAALQRIDTAGAPAPGGHNFGRGGPLAPRDAPMRAAIDALADDIDRDAVTAAWEAALREPEWGGAPVWVHGDLDARNLLVAGGRLSGVIDFGGLAVGDPASDVMVAWKIFGADTRGRFRAALSVDDATWERARGWVVSQALIALAYYTPETNAVLVREAQQWLTEALADAPD